jgi:hypothetical protein
MNRNVLTATVSFCSAVLEESMLTPEEEEITQSQTVSDLLFSGFFNVSISSL